MTAVTVLMELDGGRTVDGQLTIKLRANLAKELKRLESHAAVPMASQATPDMRTERAMLLIQLNRLDEAAAILKPLANGRNTATLLLATVYQDQPRWDESAAAFRSVLEVAWDPAATSEAARHAARVAFEGLLHNAKESRRRGDVEFWLKWGLEHFPDRAAEFEFQLGQHFANAGLPGQAMEHFDRAKQLDPSVFGRRSRQEIDRLRTHTPACLLGR